MAAHTLTVINGKKPWSVHILLIERYSMAVPAIRRFCFFDCGFRNALMVAAAAYCLHVAMEGSCHRGFIRNPEQFIYNFTMRKRGWFIFFFKNSDRHIFRDIQGLDFWDGTRLKFSRICPLPGMANNADFLFRSLSLYIYVKQPIMASRAVPVRLFFAMASRTA